MKSGTPIFGKKSLCETCTSALIIKGESENECIVQCEAHYNSPIRIPFKVIECSEWHSKISIPLHRMEKIAHIMVYKKGVGFVGFVPNRKFREQDNLTQDDNLVEDLPRGLPKDL